MHLRTPHSWRVTTYLHHCPSLLKSNNLGCQVVLKLGQTVLDLVLEGGGLAGRGVVGASLGSEGRWSFLASEFVHCTLYSVQYCTSVHNCQWWGRERGRKHIHQSLMVAFVVKMKKNIIMYMNTFYC